jgi:hypothetical protein
MNPAIAGVCPAVSRLDGTRFCRGLPCGGAPDEPGYCKGPPDPAREPVSVLLCPSSTASRLDEPGFAGVCPETRLPVNPAIAEVCPMARLRSRFYEDSCRRGPPDPAR